MQPKLDRRPAAEEIHPAQLELERMCHDMRNLIQALGLIAELIPTAVPDELLSISADIRDTQASMLELANNALERGRLMTEGYTPVAKPFSPASNLRTLASTWARTIRARGMKLELEIGDGVPDIVIGHGLLVTTVTSNFISNAAKYAPDGSTIFVKMVLANAPATMCISVRDQGAGIPEDLQDLLFQRYRQLPGAKPGSGLGLYGCKSLAQEAGGDVGFTSVCGEGSTFFVTLPYRYAEAGSVIDFSTSSERLPGGDKSKRRAALFVDDEDVSAKLAGHAFAKHNCALHAANNLIEARRLAAEGIFDVILIDEGLPDGSGIELVRNLRQDGISIPIVGMSGQDYSLEFKTAGATCFMLKPYTLAQLVSHLEVAT